MGVNTAIIQGVSGEGTAARFPAILIQLELQSEASEQTSSLVLLLLRLSGSGSASSHCLYNTSQYLISDTRVNLSLPPPLRLI